ncbi:MAG: sugar ABC transporter ATP-binding protein [Herbinix sp.]|nr:sugar ABC transporter ATP-binding protein [Herbinix sp.]
MKEVLLKTININKSFSGNIVLKDINLEIKKGEVHALMGENGAGKSTLVKIITGVLGPNTGEVIYNKEQLNINHPKELYDLGIGIVFQEFNLMPDLTVAQNIFIGREPQLKIKGFLNDKKTNALAEDILKELECTIDPERKVSDLSVAEQQMVEIAKSLSYNCNLLIMDEPTAALTENEISVLFNIIRKLRNKNVAVVYISHRMSDLDAIVDTVSVLRDGNLISTRSYTPEIKNQIIYEMVGRDLTQQFPPKPDYKKGELSLEIENLNSKNRLYNISFKAYKGEILGIVGLMGAGRTEMVKAVFGAYKRNSGIIKVDGKAVDIKNPRSAIKAGIGYLTEDRKKDGLMLGLSIRENILSASYQHFTQLGFVNDKKAGENVNEYIRRMSIKTYGSKQLAKTLSGGNQQKVMVAKWLSTKVKILIFDEPTRGIDVKSKYEIYELMYELVQNGVTIIMISSEMPEILGMSDRILVMNDGRITGDFSKEEATQEKLMKCEMMEV